MLMIGRIWSMCICQCQAVKSYIMWYIFYSFNYLLSILNEIFSISLIQFQERNMLSSVLKAPYSYDSSKTLYNQNYESGQRKWKRSEESNINHKLGSSNFIALIALISYRRKTQYYRTISSWNCFKATKIWPMKMKWDLAKVLCDKFCKKENINTMKTHNKTANAGKYCSVFQTNVYIITAHISLHCL